MTSTDGFAVSLQGLRRSFGTTKALDGLDLDLQPGELLALLGPSGCGKTTALRVLSGLEETDEGRVVVGGQDVTDVPPNRRNMAMVFQSYSLFPHLTVAQNVEFALRMRKVARGSWASIIDSHLELVGLGAQRGRFPHELSGGQQQRVALARALASKPDVLLLDEPLSALDAKVREQLRDEIRRIQTELGTTTLFVTHDQSEALAIADRVGVMNQGRLAQLSSPRDLYERPASEFVARFIGATNSLPTTAVDGHAVVFGTALPVLPGSVAGKGVALVRPERVVVTPVEAVATDGVSAMIQSLAFLGDHADVHAEMCDGGRVVARVSARDATGLAEGRLVQLSADPTPVLVVA